MAEFVIGYFTKNSDGSETRVGTETIKQVLSRPEQNNIAMRLAEVKYTNADYLVAHYTGWSGKNSFTIHL